MPTVASLVKQLVPMSTLCPLCSPSHDPWFRFFSILDRTLDLYPQVQKVDTSGEDGWEVEERP
jgi:hypothetical protein